MKIVFRDERTGEGETFHYERGILEFVEYLNRASEPVHADVIYIAGEHDGVGVEVAMQYTTEYTENVHSYVNNITPSKAARTSPASAPRLTPHAQQLRQEGRPVQGPRAHRRGLPRRADRRHQHARAAAAVRRPDQDQARQRRGRRHRQLGRRRFPQPSYLEENPKIAKMIVQKGMLAAEAREAARKAEGPDPRAQRRPLRRRPARQAPRLHQPRRRASASCTWSRAIRPAAAPKAAGSASTRRSCRCAARSSTPTSRAKTRCWPTKKSAA